MYPVDVLFVILYSFVFVILYSFVFLVQFCISVQDCPLLSGVIYDMKTECLKIVEKTVFSVLCYTVYTIEFSCWINIFEHNANVFIFIVHFNLHR